MHYSGEGVAGDPFSAVERVWQKIHASQWRGFGRGSLHYSGERVWQGIRSLQWRGCGRGSIYYSGEGVAGDPVWQNMVVHIISFRMQREGI